MPKIYEYFGLIFMLYYNDHLPIHVHVSKGENQSKFELVFKKGRLFKVKTLKYRKFQPLSIHDSKIAVSFIDKYSLHIVDKWNKVVVLNKSVKFEKITKKV